MSCEIGQPEARCVTKFDSLLKWLCFVARYKNDSFGTELCSTFEINIVL